MLRRESAKCRKLMMLTVVMAAFPTAFASIQQEIISLNEFYLRPVASGSWGTRKPLSIASAAMKKQVLDFPRGGGGDESGDKEDDDEDEDDEEEEDEDESDEEEEDEYDEEDPDGYEEYSEEEGEILDEDTNADVNVDKYDEPMVQSPMMQMYATFGVILLSKRVDLFNPVVVRIARFAFIGYIVLLQMFLLFVRIRAKMNNDRTPVSLSNPINSLLQSQLEGEDGSSGMVKNLASSFLSSESTIVEYDLKQAKNMQGGLLMNMLFMWYLHFKMEQVQPLLIQSLTGFLNMIYSPLFQVYVMGRNLERPFKSPNRMENDPPSVTEETQEDAANTELSLALEEGQEGLSTNDNDAISVEADNEEKGEKDSDYDKAEDSDEKEDDTDTEDSQGD